MERIVLLFFCLIATHLLKAQSDCPPPFDMRKSGDSRYQLGAGVGLTNLKGDNKSSSGMGLGYYLNFDYKLSKGVFVGLRGQIGELKMVRTNTDFREMNSKYTAIGAGILLHPFEIINQEDERLQMRSIGKDILESFYLGVDALSVSNSIKSINRGNPIRNHAYGPTEGVDANGRPIFKQTVHSLMLPSLNIGFAQALIKNKRRRNSSSKNIFRLVLNAQFNFANNDDLDGYTPIDDNKNRVSQENDRYNFYSLGVRYSF